MPTNIKYMTWMPGAPPGGCDNVTSPSHWPDRDPHVRNNTCGPAATVYRLQKVLILRSVLIKWQQGVVRSISLDCFDSAGSQLMIELTLLDEVTQVSDIMGSTSMAIDSFTVPLHSPAVRAVQPLGTVTGVWKPVGIPTGHMRPKSSK